MSKFIRPLFVLLFSAILFLAWYAHAEEHDLLEVFPPEGVADVYFVESNGHVTSFSGDAEAFYILPAPETCRVDVYIRMPYEPYQHFQRFDLCENPETEQNPPYIPTGIECLGMDWPGAGEFVVDGNSYSFDNHLSFIVPFDAIWSWQLFIDEHLVLTFEQTEPGNCHIVYPS
jgi:hypothetical protein